MGRRIEQGLQDMSFLSPSAPGGPINWKTNLAIVWLSQFLSLSAFSFCLPFLPLYMKEKHIVPVEDVTFWSGVFIAAAPVSLMIMSPIWGGLGDRFGRKMMLVRATFAGAVALYLMSVTDDIIWLIVLRLLQGAFTGTTPSAQSLVAAATPEKYQGFALGLLMAAINAANTAGMFFGGKYAEYFGAEATFRMSGYLLLASTALVFLLVRENFTPPRDLLSKTRSARIRRRRTEVERLRSNAWVLAGIAFVALVITYDGPFMSLYVEALYHDDPAATMAAGVESRVFGITGTINAIASAIAIGGAIGISYLMDRKIPLWAWAFIALGSVAGVWWIYHFASIGGLTAGRSIFLFFSSGLSSVLVVILSRMTPPEKQGSAMGWSVTARSAGWILAPLMGGWAARHLGYAGAYGLLCVMALALAVYFPCLAAHHRDLFTRGPDSDDRDNRFDEVVLPPQSMPVTARASARMFPGAEEDETR